jgi:hypothetical protein
MPFSAITCLTYTGNTTLGGVLNLYSDYDGFLIPFQTSVSLSTITGNNCPYYLNNVPIGTTKIRIKDTLTGCFCDLDLPSDLCLVCDLNFDSYSGTSVGRITVGDLTGTCDPSITDYRVFWYETGDTVNPVVITGFGTEFQPYSFTHPLTNTSAVLVTPGTYKPVIDKIKIDGVTFSNTGGTNTIQADLNCFETQLVTIEPFTCTNGNSSDDILYEHRINFFGSSSGTIPQTLSGDFIFTGSSNYLAWKFKGFDVEDRIRLIYSGSAYSEPLLIEDIKIGSNLDSSNFDLSLLPKSAATTTNTVYVKKVTCLTGITRNNGDFIRIEVEPNQSNPQTSWDFYCTCLNSFNQDSCVVNNIPNKIVLSGLSKTFNSCNETLFTVPISSCTINDDVSKYLFSTPTPISEIKSTYLTNQIYTNGAGGIQSYGITLKLNSLDFDFNYTPYSPFVCDQSGYYITFMKYVSGTTGIIDIEFENVTDFNTYYNSFLTLQNNSLGSLGGNCATSPGPFSGTPYDPSDIRYYRYYNLIIPGAVNNENCGDLLTPSTYYIHTSTQVTTGYTGNYLLRFTMPTITNGLTYDPVCNLSGYVQSTFVNTINDDSTGTTNNYTGTTNLGVKYTEPFFSLSYLCSGVTSSTGTTLSLSLFYPKYLNETIVYTGVSPTLVPSLSGETFYFDLTKFKFNNLLNNLGYYSKYGAYYKLILNNPLDFRDFEIYTTDISTGEPTGPEILIYGYTGVTSAYTVYQPSYFV